MFSFRQNDSVLNHTESVYTTGPCNNQLLNSTQATTDTAIIASEGDLSKNSNLLVNVLAKDDLTEKKGVMVNVVNTGTIGRNGTLCKKVYI
jgi:hypothetical protein